LTRASKIVDGKKRCGKCKKWLPVEEFYKLARAATGLASACKSCTLTVHQNAKYHVRYKQRDPVGVAAEKRRRHIKTMYGVTPEWYDAMMESQGGVCAICEQRETVMRFGKLKLLSVDHDHTTGKPRGLLCQGCNQGIGHLGEDIVRMEAAAQYLEAHAPKDPETEPG
jgi:hypothetical protein